MTEAQEKLAGDLVNNPPPGGEFAKARQFGVDLTLVIATLTLRARTGSLRECLCLSTRGTKRFTRQVNLEETLRVRGEAPTAD